MNRDTGKAKLPGLPAVTTGNASLDRWIQAVTERLEVREGARGNAYERVVLLRELKALGLDPSAVSSNAATGTENIMVQTPLGTFVRMSIDSFADKIRNTKLYRDLIKSLNDTTRFEDLPGNIQQILYNSIAEEAAKRGADIQQIEKKIQTAEASLAYKVDEITAAVGNNSAGVRDLGFAYATESRAQAGKVTQLEASLGNYYQDGSPGRAVLEETMTVTADRVQGLAAEYMVKVQVGADGKLKVAGFGLAATEDPEGNQDSAFIVLADKFAVVTPTDTFADPMNPPADRIPFGVDVNGVYMNGQVRIDASGPTIAKVLKSIRLTSSNAAFKVNTSGVASPTSITLTVTPSSGLTGTTTFTILTGSATLSGSGLTRTVAYSSMTGDQLTVRATLTDADGYAYMSDVSIYKAYDGAQGVQGEQGVQGAKGADGVAGTRGSVTRYGSGSSWSDSAANSLVPGGTPVIGDTVTISSSTQAFTKYWSGTNWVDPGVVIDGNLLVNGSISGTKIAAGTLTAGTGTINKAVIGYSGSNTGTKTFVNGICDVDVYTPNGIGTPLYTVAAQPPANMVFGHSLYYNNAGLATIRLTAQVSGVPYNGDLWMTIVVF